MIQSDLGSLPCLLTLLFVRQVQSRFAPCLCFCSIVACRDAPVRCHPHTATLAPLRHLGPTRFPPLVARQRALNGFWRPAVLPAAVSKPRDMKASVIPTTHEAWRLPSFHHDQHRLPSLRLTAVPSSRTLDAGNLRAPSHRQKQNTGHAMPRFVGQPFAYGGAVTPLGRSFTACQRTAAAAEDADWTCSRQLTP